MERSKLDSTEEPREMDIGEVGIMEGIENSVYAKRICISLLVLALIVSLLLIYFGWFGHIPAVFFKIGFVTAGIETPILLYLWWTGKYKITLRSFIDGATRIYQVLTKRLRKRRTVNAHARLLIPRDNPAPVVDYPITRPPADLEQSVDTAILVESSDESSSDETTIKDTPQAETETLITWLAQNRTGVSSAPFSEKVRYEQSLPIESWMPREMRRAMDGYEMTQIYSATFGSSMYNPTQQDDFSSCDHMMRPVPNPKIPLLQQSPQQGQYSLSDSLQMPLSSEMPRQETSVQGRFSLVSQRQIVPGVHVSSQKGKQVQDPLVPVLRPTMDLDDQQNLLRQRKISQESPNLPTQTRI